MLSKRNLANYFDQYTRPFKILELIGLLAYYGIYQIRFGYRDLDFFDLNVDEIKYNPDFINCHASWEIGHNHGLKITYSYGPDNNGKMNVNAVCLKEGDPETSVVYILRKFLAGNPIKNNSQDLYEISRFDPSSMEEMEVKYPMAETQYNDIVTRVVNGEMSMEIAFEEVSKVNPTNKTKTKCIGLMTSKSGEKYYEIAPVKEVI